MATLKQLELWHSKAHTRVVKFRSEMTGFTSQKKELGRPKTPKQVVEKEKIVLKIARAKDELEHAKRQIKDYDIQIKQAKKEEKEKGKAKASTLSKALNKKFGKSVSKKISRSASVKNTKKSKKLSERVAASEGSHSEIQSFLSEAVKMIEDLSHRIEKLERK